MQTIPAATSGYAMFLFTPTFGPAGAIIRSVHIACAFTPTAGLGSGFAWAGAEGTVSMDAVLFDGPLLTADVNFPIWSGRLSGMALGQNIFSVGSYNIGLYAESFSGVPVVPGSHNFALNVQWIPWLVFNPSTNGAAEILLEV